VFFPFGEAQAHLWFENRKFGVPPEGEKAPLTSHREEELEVLVYVNLSEIGKVPLEDTP